MARISADLSLLALLADTRQFPNFLAVAVVCGVGADDAAATGRGAGDAQGDLVGLCTGAGENDAGQWIGVEVRQAFGVVEDAFMQIAAVDVQRLRLCVHGLDDVGVAVADTGHVVVHIQVAAAFGVEQPDALPARDVERILVENRRPRSQKVVRGGRAVRLCSSLLHFNCGNGSRIHACALLFIFDDDIVAVNAHRIALDP